MKGISALIEGVLAIAITLTVAMAVGNFLMTTAQNSSQTVAESSGEKINCAYANFYIKNATFDASGDCTMGTNHSIVISVKNSGQVGLNIDSIAVESKEGKVLNYNINQKLSTGEIKTLTGTSEESCLDFIRQNATTDYKNKISRIFASSGTCSISNEVGTDYISCQGCNQTELKPSRYLMGLWHFNSNLNDSSGYGINGVFYGGSATYVAGKFGNAMSLNGSQYVELSLAENKTTILFWYKNASSSGWAMVVNSSGTNYVNGSIGTPGTYPVYISGNVVQIGKIDASTYFNGTIDEVAIYNRSLSADEIMDDYVKGLK